MKLYSQIADNETYNFINSVYLNHVDSTTTEYYLYDKPLVINLVDEDLLDTITQLLSREESKLLWDKILWADYSLRWEEERLFNARIIDDNSLINHDCEEFPVYYFSLPIFSSSFDFAIFQVKFDKGYLQATYLTFYRKRDKNWEFCYQSVATGKIRIKDPW